MVIFRGIVLTPVLKRPCHVCGIVGGPVLARSVPSYLWLVPLVFVHDLIVSPCYVFVFPTWDQFYPFFVVE
jgi:hypothetical protein